jgi:hypothetical protein
LASARKKSPARHPPLARSVAGAYAEVKLTPGAKDDSVVAEAGNDAEALELTADTGSPSRVDVLPEHLAPAVLVVAPGEVLLAPSCRLIEQFSRPARCCWRPLKGKSYRLKERGAGIAPAAQAPSLRDSA